MGWSPKIAGLSGLRFSGFIKNNRILVSAGYLGQIATCRAILKTSKETAKWDPSRSAELCPATRHHGISLRYKHAKQPEDADHLERFGDEGGWIDQLYAASQLC